MQKTVKTGFRGERKRKDKSRTDRCESSGRGD